MSRRLLLAAVAASSVTLGGCDVINDIFGGGAAGDSVDTAASLDGGSSTAGGSGTDEPTRSDASVDTSGDPTPTRGEREVEFPVVAESVTRSVFGADLTAKFAGATVPVLAPAGMSDAQAEQFASSYRETPDGYFARIPGDAYDVVVNATRVYAVAPAEAGDVAREPAPMRIGESETGLGVTMSRYGADYSIDFACRGAGDEGGADCVSEEEAAAFVERLIPVGGGGQ